MIPGQEPELIGKREGCREVVHRQELCLVAVEPERGFMILALWATAVPAGAGALGCIAAVRALHKHLAGLGCAATPDGHDGTQMSRQEP